MPLPNMHLNKGKYLKSGKEIKHFSTISDISCIRQVYKDGVLRVMTFQNGCHEHFNLVITIGLAQF